VIRQNDAIKFIDTRVIKFNKREINIMIFIANDCHTFLPNINNIQHLLFINMLLTIGKYLSRYLAVQLFNTVIFEFRYEIIFLDSSITRQ